MMQFTEIEQTMNTRGVYFTTDEYKFALLTVLGEETYVAYALAFENEQYKKVKGSEDEKEFFNKCAKNGVALTQKQHIIQLSDELRYRHKKLIQDAALNLEDIELTSSDIKKVLAAFLRDRIDDPSSASVKELVDLLRMYQPYLPDDASATDFQRHFIQVHEHFNALCTNCNRELTAFKGLHVVCEHCGTKYVWDETEERFYPQIETL